MSSDADWYLFQEEICEHFRSIGADAETNVTVQGVRTKHDIDVLVKTKFLGEDLLWVVEAKKWKSKVNKLQVLGLRTIVEDIGADRGFIISSAGFQSGAVESAENTNVKLKTFEQLKSDTRGLVEDEILKIYSKRAMISSSRYWSHGKRIRQKYGLRDDAGVQPDYSGHQVLSKIEEVISQAKKKNYPICLNTINYEKVGDESADDFQQVINWLNLNFNLLDEKIIKAEVSMLESGEFNPRLRYEH